MIELSQIGNISGIYFTSILIVYLIIVELFNGRIKKTMLPLLILLIVVFLLLNPFSKNSRGR